MSDWRFLLFSEWTALASRSVQEGSKTGAMKNWAKRSRAPEREVGWMSKLALRRRQCSPEKEEEQRTSSKSGPCP